jgi:prepilin peptidase CpaA
VATLAGVAFTAILVAAAIGDLRTRRIPNRLVATLALLGVVFSLVHDHGWPGLPRAGGGLLVGLACWLPFYALGWIGAGDVKLYAAAGAWLGPMRALDGAIVGALSGAVLSLIWMMKAHGVKYSVRTLGLAAGTPQLLAPGTGAAARRSTLPYGVAIGTGALCAGWLPRLFFS